MKPVQSNLFIEYINQNYLEGMGIERNGINSIRMESRTEIIKVLVSFTFFSKKRDFNDMP